jgi:hypothetical protein
MAQTLHQLGTNPVQNGDVSLHQLEDFAGVAAVRAAAFDVDHAAQLVASLPPQAFADQTSFDPKDNAAQKSNALMGRDVIADPTRRFRSALDEVCKHGTALTARS